MSLENKVAIITGSGSGMGAATAVLFAKEKAKVVIVDINETGANNVEEKCKEFGVETLVLKSDISKDEEASNVITKTVEKFAMIDILVNNAGIIRDGKILDGSLLETYDEIINNNLRSVVLMTTFAAPYLVKSKGCIINISSVVVTSPKVVPLSPIYACSKAAVSRFTTSSAIELAPSVRVNAVCPGPVRTQILAHLPVDWESFTEATVLKRCLDPKEIAELVLFLSSDKGNGITGSSYVIDAGMLIK